MRALDQKYNSDYSIWALKLPWTLRVRVEGLGLRA